MQGIYMQNSERALIYEDLCHRLPYKPTVFIYYMGESYDNILDENILAHFRVKKAVIIPYLRNIETDMTSDEIDELDELGFSTQTGVFRNYQHLNPSFVGFLANKEFDEKTILSKGISLTDTMIYIKWLYQHHFNISLPDNLYKKPKEEMYNNYFGGHII